jgi:hypothetical protein
MVSIRTFITVVMVTIAVRIAIVSITMAPIPYTP